MFSRRPRGAQLGQRRGEAPEPTPAAAVPAPHCPAGDSAPTGDGRRLAGIGYRGSAPSLLRVGGTLGLGAAAPVLWGLPEVAGGLLGLHSEPLPSPCAPHPSATRWTK